jgi:protein ATS1
MSTHNDTSQSIYYKLWAFGSNGSGQLGIGHTEDVSAPQECKGALNLSSSAIRQLAAGGNHTVATLMDGTFASTGDNSDGRGIVTRAKHIFTTWQKQELSSGEKQDLIPHVAATWSVTIACHSEGSVCAAGSGNSGELGIDPHTSVAEAATQVRDFLPPGDTIIKIASGMGHVVVVLASGEIWGWGKGRKGQLGMPAENVWTPRKIEHVPFKVFDAVCGKDGRERESGREGETMLGRRES